jgi:hypothetical protein
MLMPAAAARQDEREPEQGARAVLDAVADRLTDHGLDILGPPWDEPYRFRVPNVRGALCEVTVRENGTLAWEYRPFHGSRSDPAQLAAIAAAVLGAGAAASLPSRSAGLTLKGVIALALRERGLSARLASVVPDEAACEVYAEVEITNPARPGRGAVRVSDDGMVLWECPADGTGALEFAEAIAAAVRP